MICRIVCVVFLLAVWMPASLPAQEKPPVLDVWPGKAPGETGAIGEEKFQEQKPGEKSVQRLTNVSRPTISHLSAHEGKRHRGGGPDRAGRRVQHSRLGSGRRRSGGLAELDRRHRHRAEISRAAPAGRSERRRSDRRAPGRPAGHEPGPQQGRRLEDRRQAHRHARLLRGGPSDGVAFDQLPTSGRYEPIDDVDKVSCRPDFAVLIYPGGLIEKGKNTLRADIRVTKETPPMFFAHASNDPVSAENSVALYLALQRAKVPAEMHLYRSGGHGFGLRQIRSTLFDLARALRGVDAQKADSCRPTK